MLFGVLIDRMSMACGVKLYLIPINTFRDMRRTNLLLQKLGWGNNSIILVTGFDACILYFLTLRSISVSSFIIYL